MYGPNSSQYIFDMQMIRSFSEGLRLTSFAHVSVPLLLERAIIRQAWLDKHWKFAFVRNPWERLVSIWRWRFNRLSTSQYVTDDFALFVDELPYIAPIGIYSNELPPSEATTQLAWLRHNGQWLVDFIGRYENLQEDWTAISQALGIGQRLTRARRTKLRWTLPYRISTELKPFRDFYNDHTRQVVAQFYAEEIELFGFTFE